MPFAFEKRKILSFSWWRVCGSDLSHNATVVGLLHWHNYKMGMHELLSLAENFKNWANGQMTYPITISCRNFGIIKCEIYWDHQIWNTVFPRPTISELFSVLIYKQRVSAHLWTSKARELQMIFHRFSWKEIFHSFILLRVWDRRKILQINRCSF